MRGKQSSRICWEGLGRLLLNARQHKAKLHKAGERTGRELKANFLKSMRESWDSEF